MNNSLALFGGILTQAVKDYCVLKHKKKVKGLTVEQEKFYTTANHLLFHKGELEWFMRKFSVDMEADYIRRLIKQGYKNFVKSGLRASYFRRIDIINVTNPKKRNDDERED